ncbi:NAD(P)H-hydrate epimerase [Cryobacterium sp. Hz7]|uniref:NAD(P)H-hydrate epimerase n=2 Tax=Microbacteriaceae TaxID=85023 RepID=A0ABY2JLK0_9MICO|nr:NAD(P)H-hydrate epimerase [Cryobacterium sp. Hz7]TFD06307.1 NAD(P)H-hydrate epimerase [Cryobacterium sandaracinum]
MREAETPFLAEGVPLMERASAALAAETAALLEELLTESGGVPDARVLVLAGAGNNGGDALHAAALLAAQGALVTIVPTSAQLHDGGLSAALAAGAALLPLAETDAALARVARVSAVILDGILGTGTGTSTSPALRGRAREVVAAILPALHDPGAPLVVAVDLPSGIGVDDGAVPDPTVLPAHLTVTFGGCKPGLLREPAASLAGRIVVADIGIGDELERIAARDRG